MLKDTTVPTKVAFTCPDGKRTRNGFCGWVESDEAEGCCRHCCFGCEHAVNMDCSFVCDDVAAYYYPEEEEPK